MDDAVTVTSPGELVALVPHLLGIAGGSGNFFDKLWFLLQHLPSVPLAPVLTEFLKLAHVLRVEVHGPPEELTKLKEPLAPLNPQWFEFYAGVNK